jgi:hypothetical protein
MGAQLLAPLAMDQTTFTDRPVAEPRAVGHQPTPRRPRPGPAMDAAIPRPGGQHAAVDPG